jgi:glycerophosphoryl diester phosphodiesterase
VQLPRLLQMMLYFRWILDALLLVGISLLAGLWLRAYLSHLPAPKGPVMILPAVMALLILIALWVLPLVSPPDSVYRGSLPKKPSLIAHRGVAMLAPENTLAAVNLAARQGVYGVETDIRISADGIPFLMHDASLERTTNLQEVYPERLKDRPEEFTIAELTQLEAGNWFVARDPFGTVAGGQVSQEEIKEYALQKVPTFAEALAIIRQSNLAFIFDLEPPPGDHPYAKSLFNICFNMIHDAGLDNQVWFLASEEQAEILRANAPEMKIAYGTDYRHPPSVELLQKFGYKMINSEYGLSKALIRKYQEAGLWVNLWTVDEPWQYSRLWLLGVDSTTTNNARTMLALNQPAWSIPYGKYLALWGFMGLASLALVLWLTLPVLR